MATFVIATVNISQYGIPLSLLENAGKDAGTHMQHILE